MFDDVRLNPSITLIGLLKVSVAPTPFAPLLYVTVPPVKVAKFAVVATSTGALMLSPAARLSTYSFVAASLGSVGAATLLILLLLTMTTPLPNGSKTTLLLPALAAIVIAPVLLTTRSVITLLLKRALPSTVNDTKLPRLVTLG